MEKLNSALEVGRAFILLKRHFSKMGAGSLGGGRVGTQEELLEFGTRIPFQDHVLGSSQCLMLLPGELASFCSSSVGVCVCVCVCVCLVEKTDGMTQRLEVIS